MVVLYIPPDTLRTTGYPDVDTAQLEFFTRARLLYDFGCEGDELVLLQGSVFLGSFQHSLDGVKESRFWFTNAVRLGKQLGVHRRCVSAFWNRRVSRGVERKGC